jgi:hypothetical protein
MQFNKVKVINLSGLFYGLTPIKKPLSSSGFKMIGSTIKLKLFPLLLFLCSKVFLRTNVRGGKGVLRR